MKYFVTIALAACVLVSLNSCTKCDRLGQQALERSIAKGIEQGTGGQVDIGLGHAVRLPAGFPKELVPPGGKPLAKWSVHNKEGGGDIISFETSASVDRVVSYYEGLSGWTSEGNMEATTGTVMTLKAGENESALVTVAQTEGKTNVSIVYSKK